MVVFDGPTTLPGSNLTDPGPREKGENENLQIYLYYCCRSVDCISISAPGHTGVVFMYLLVEMFFCNFARNSAVVPLFVLPPADFIRASTNPLAQKYNAIYNYNFHVETRAKIRVGMATGNSAGVFPLLTK